MSDKPLPAQLCTGLLAAQSFSVELWRRFFGWIPAREGSELGSSAPLPFLCPWAPGGVDSVAMGQEGRAKALLPLSVPRKIYKALLETLASGYIPAHILSFPSHPWDTTSYLFL